MVVSRKKEPLSMARRSIIIVPAGEQSIRMDWNRNAPLFMYAVDAPVIGHRTPNGKRIVENGHVVAPFILRFFHAHPEFALRSFIRLPLIDHLLASEGASSEVLLAERGEIKSARGAHGEGVLGGASHLGFSVNKMSVGISRPPSSAVKVPHWLERDIHRVSLPGHGKIGDDSLREVIGALPDRDLSHPGRHLEDHRWAERFAAHGDGRPGRIAPLS